MTGRVLLVSAWIRNGRLLKNELKGVGLFFS
jgi:hypothetical protein